MEAVRQKRRVIKRPIKEMMPVKKWLSLAEACAYMDLSVNIFHELMMKCDVTISTLPPIGKSKRSNKKYFRVSELDQIIEDNIFISRVS